MDTLKSMTAEKRNNRTQTIKLNTIIYIIIQIRPQR